MKLNAFMVMKIHNVAFWVMASCNPDVGYQCFEGTSCLHLHPKRRKKNDPLICWLAVIYQNLQSKDPGVHTYMNISEIIRGQAIA